MPFEGKHGVVLSHAAAIVGDGDQLPAAGLYVDANAGCTSVERILEKLLDHRCRPLDNLACSNFVGDIVREYANAAHPRQAITELQRESRKTFHHGDTESRSHGVTEKIGEFFACE